MQAPLLERGNESSADGGGDGGGLSRATQQDLERERSEQGMQLLEESTQGSSRRRVERERNGQVQPLNIAEYEEAALSLHAAIHGRRLGHFKDRQSVKLNFLSLYFMADIYVIVVVLNMSLPSLKLPPVGAE